MNRTMLWMVAAALPMSHAALAQSDQMGMAQLAMANQAGVMQYCRGKGWVDQAAVDAQQKSAMAVPPGDKSAAAAAEGSGKAGKIYGPSGYTPMSEMATKSNTTEQALCAQMGDSAKQVAAMSSSMPGMPTMPGGMPSMSGMPSMGGMPSGMPTMPGMPGAPQVPR